MKHFQCDCYYLSRDLRRTDVKITQKWGTGNLPKKIPEHQCFSHFPGEAEQLKWGLVRTGVRPTVYCARNCIVQCVFSPGKM